MWIFCFGAEVHDLHLLFARYRQIEVRGSRIVVPREWLPTSFWVVRTEDLERAVF